MNSVREESSLLSTIPHRLRVRTRPMTALMVRRSVITCVVVYVVTLLAPVHLSQQKMIEKIH